MCGGVKDVFADVDDSMVPCAGSSISRRVAKCPGVPLEKTHIQIRFARGVSFTPESGMVFTSV